MDSAIRVENVTKIYKLYDKPVERLKESLGLTRKKLYKEHYALRDISFDVKKGETVGIIGTNGSGKSTILKIITGVLNPTGGNVTINGRISALLELGAGFNMEYTGIENVYLNGTMIGYSKEEIDKKLSSILEFADIGDFINQPVKTYSSGMFVRLAFAVAINIEPEILIVDEALSVGDVFFQAKCYHKFEEFKKLGKTILFVSHDLNSISKYCDRVILLNKGVKLKEGNPKEIVDIYKKLLVNQYDEKEDSVAEIGQAIKEEGSTRKDELKKYMQTNPKVVEYGEKEAEIIDFGIADENGTITNTIEKNTVFKVKMTVEFHQSIQDPIFAFTIKDLRGTEIAGTNSLFEGVDLGLQQAGNIRKIEFSQKMELRGGEYLISLGCTGYRNGEFTVYHRLYDVCSLSVIADREIVGYFDMHAKVSIQ